MRGDFSIFPRYRPYSKNERSADELDAANSKLLTSLCPADTHSNVLTRESALPIGATLSLQGSDIGNAISRPKGCRSYFPSHGSKVEALDPPEYEFLSVIDPVQDDTYY